METNLKTELKSCQMCGIEISRHPRCKKCGLLLHKYANKMTLCFCQSYHAYSTFPDLCLPCAGLNELKKYNDE